MMNLKQPVAKILITDWTSLTGSLRVGLYEDYVTKRKVLSFKEEGINIFGDAVNGTHASPAAPTASGTLFSGFEGMKACTDPGAQKFQFVELNPACSCDPCDYGYYLTIEKHVKLPGVNNNENNMFRKSYSGIVPVVSCSGTPSTIDDAILLQMEDDLITQISSDNGMMNQNSDLTTGTMAPAEARRAYIITDVLAGSTGIIITTPDGVATTIATGVTAIATAHAINNTAAVQQYVMAFATSINGTDYSVCIMSRTNGVLFTIALAAGSTATIDHRYIAFIAKSANVQYAIQYPLGFATTTKANLLILSGNTTVGTTTISAVYGGVLYTAGAANDNATDSTYAANLNTAIAALATPPDQDLAGSYDAYTSKVYVYGSNLISGLTATFSATSTTTVVEYSGTGTWPSLTGLDVFNIFFNAKDAGGISAMQYLNQVNPEDSYCHYVLKSSENTFAHHGASHTNHYAQEVHLYIKSTLVDGATDYILDSTNPAVTGVGNTYNQTPETNAAALAAWSADTTLETALGIWAGAAVSTW